MGLSGCSAEALLAVSDLDTAKAFTSTSCPAFRTQAGASAVRPGATALDKHRSSERCSRGARFARSEWERRGAPAVLAVATDQSRSPALADIIGALRLRTATMISSGSIPRR